MLSVDSHWSVTLVFAALAVSFALVGLGLEAAYPGAAPLLATALLAGSLACTAVAFGRLALRLRRLELESLGLIEEVSQEFDRVRDRIDVFSEALGTSGQPDEDEGPGIRRVTVK